MGTGVYPDRGIIDFLKRGVVLSERQVLDSQVQPSSLDLRIGQKAYNLPFEFVPPKGESLEKFLRDKSLYKIDLNELRLLHRNQVYVVEIEEMLALPRGVIARANPKSSTGRTDLHVKLLADGNEYYDSIPEGYNGKMWMQLFSGSFDVRVKRGLALNQLRFYDIGTKNLEKDELKNIPLGEEILESNSDGKVPLRINLSTKGVVGYKARYCASPVDLTRTDNLARNYFEPIKADEDGSIVLENGVFYILHSIETIKIPNNRCSEMEAIDVGSGDIRMHYAGFFDPAFEGNIVMEVRSYGKSPVYIQHGQSVASFELFPLRESPLNLYGDKSNYQGQTGPRLAKFFKQ